MKVKSFKQFLSEHFNDDDSIEVTHCDDGGCLIMPQIGDDDTFICLSTESGDEYFYGEQIDLAACNNNVS